MIHKPDYKKIFEDIILEICPERQSELSYYLNKDNFSILEIIDLNKKIFGSTDKETLDFNQRHKSYDSETILKILAYQEDQKLSNLQLANHFKLSRNTVSKWKRLYMKSN